MNESRVTSALNKAFTQTEFAELVGVSQPAISALLSEGKLPPCSTLGEMLLAYCERLRDQAGGRLGSEPGGLDLVQERAALARSQRVAQDLKNDIARGEYAPIGLLADVLGLASSAVVDRFEQLEGALRKSCPGLPVEALTTVMQIIAAARNEWIRSTVKLVAQNLDNLAAEQEDAELEADLDEEMQES